MRPRKPNWKEVINGRRKENFVGRADYLRMFSNNFCTEIPTFLLFSVTGEGGVGKSTLLKQYENIVNSSPVEGIAVICDDTQLSPAAVMGYIAEKIAQYDIKQKEFDELYKTYRMRREEIESDPKAPRGALNLVVRGMTDFAIKTAKQTPGVGILAEYVNEKEASEALTQGVNYLINRFTNKDEIRLLREPENVLTPHFIKLLNRVCDQRRIVLIFDVFERTCESLSPWLLECLNFKFGEFDINLTLVISGREVLDQHWTEFGSSICHVTLEPFILEETAQYLANRRITDDLLVAQIQEDTGGLPVLVELLAGTNPKPNFPLPDISKDAVKRFLQWIPEEEKRRVALLAAVPRQFNLDILGACLGSDAAILFNWLTTQSYIRTSSVRGWFYHEKVRELMLRYLHNTTPGELEKAHERLVNYFEKRQLSIEGTSARGSRSWDRLEIERIYHLLSEQPTGNISKAVNAFLAPSGCFCGFGESIPQACQQVGREVISSELKDFSQTLISFYQAYDSDEHETLLPLANLLAQRSDLNPEAQYGLFARRAYSYRILEKYPEAIADFDRAIALNNEGCWAIVYRGETYFDMGEHENALADFNRVIAIKPDCGQAIGARGKTFREMGKYSEAIADFEQIIAHNSRNVFAFSQRGETYRAMGNYAEALTDFDKALKLDNKNHWCHEQRGRILHNLERYEEALNSFSEAEKLEPTCAFCFSLQGRTYRIIGKYPEALVCLDRAIKLDKQSHYAHEERGRVLYELERFEEALNSFNEAQKIIPECSSCIKNRAEIHRRMGRYSESIDDFDRLIVIMQSNNMRIERAIIERGITYRLMGRFTEALSNFDQAISIDDKSASALAWRGEMYRRLARYDESIKDLSLAIQIDQDDDNFIYSRRAATYLALDDFDAAESDMIHVLESSSNTVAALYNKAVVCSLQGNTGEAILLLSEAIQGSSIARNYAQNDDLFDILKNISEFQKLMNT